jgi:protein-tyrosine phosphatase
LYVIVIESLSTDAIRDWGAVAVVTLLEPQELVLLKVHQLGEEVARRDMAWFHLPIADVRIPDDAFERAWESAGKELRSMLRKGLDVLVHCRGGLGRAGTIATRLLVELGVESLAAIAKVREVRPGAIETRNQERFSRYDKRGWKTYHRVGSAKLELEIRLRCRQRTFRLNGPPPMLGSRFGRRVQLQSS